MVKQWKYNKFIGILEMKGYTYLRDGKGSHRIYGNSEGNIIAIPKKEKVNRMMAQRLLKEIERKMA